MDGNWSGSGADWFPGIPDTSPPTISIASPSASVYANATIGLNFTATSLYRNISACWYSLNGGENTSLALCANSSINATDGSNSLAVFANDTAGNAGNASVNFTVDASAPNITISSPVPSALYNASSVPLNFTATDPHLDTCWVLVNGTLNSTGCNNFTLTFADGNHTITVLANDTLGHTGDSSVSFIVDTSHPTISISSPSASVYSATAISLNFTAASTYRNLSSCWYSLNRGANTTIENCSNTTITASTGANTLRLDANDTAGYRAASATVAFVVNTNGSASIANSHNVTINSSATAIVVVPSNVTLQQITILSSVPPTTAILVLFGARLNASADNQTILSLNASLNVARDTGAASYMVKLPENVTIIGPANWTGEIILPTVKPSSAVSITPPVDYTLTVAAVVEMGFGSRLNLTSAARVLFPGDAGKLIGYTDAGGAVTPITTACNADDQAAVDAQLTGATLECKINSGSDLVVWTRHFTTFATYTLALVQSSPGPSGNNNGGGSIGGGGLPASSKISLTYPVDIGIAECNVSITREISSATGRSTLATTLENKGGEGCTLSDFAFSDCIPQSFANVNDITFTPIWSTKNGSTVSFSFPGFAPGESKTITYSVGGWALPSSVNNFTTVSLSARKQAAAPAPQQNATPPEAKNVQPPVQEPAKKPSITIKIPEITPETVQQVQKEVPISVAVTIIIVLGGLVVGLAVALLVFRARNKSGKGSRRSH